MTISPRKKYKGYNSAHLWLYRTHGKASYCSNDVSHTGTFQWANITGVYEKDLSNFTQLCRSCHAKLDTSDYQRELSAERLKGNTYRRKTIHQYTLDGQLVDKYPSLTHAAHKVGIVRTAISNCLTGRSKKAAGYKWQYEGGVL